MRNISKFKVLYLTIFIFILSFTITIFALNKNVREMTIVRDNREWNIVDNDTKILDDLREKYNNSDVVAKIQIPDSNIDEAVMKTKDNDYYLNHSNNRDYNIHGSIYMDYRIDIDKAKKILIYGHSSPGDSINVVPFNELEEYYSYNYYKKHQDIVLTLDNEIRYYKIFSVYVEVNDFKYMNLNFEDIDSWYNHLLALKSKSLYNTNIDIDKEDEILILQTCSNNREYSKYKEKYLLVIAKRIK